MLSSVSNSAPSRSTRPTIFVLHFPGDAVGADLIKKLSADVEVVSIDLTASAERWQTIEGIARGALAEVLHHPRQHYNVLGLGSSWVVAYELAMQLCGEDQALGLIALLPRADRSLVTFHAAINSYHIREAPFDVSLLEVDNDGQRPVILPGGPPPMSRAAARFSPEQLVDRLFAEQTRRKWPRRAWSPTVLPLQSGSGDEALICCIPGAGSSSLCFQALAAALGNRNPIRGLEPRGLDGAALPHASVEAAARAYLPAILETSKPVHLVGHSHGGMVALELALQLQSLGLRPASLTVIDSWELPEKDSEIELSERDVLDRLVAIYEQRAGRSFPANGKELAALRGNDLNTRVRDGLADVGILSRNTNPDLLAGPLATFSRAIRCSYRPAAKFDGICQYVAVADPEQGVEMLQRAQIRKVLSWRRVAEKSIVWSAPGNHMSVLCKPNVLALAQWWRHSTAV